MIVELFNPIHDDAMVKELLRQQAMQFAGFDLVYDRGVHFPRLLQLQGQNSQTYLAKENGLIAAVISVSSCLRWLNGTLVPVGLIGDFRINGGREIRKQWRGMLDEILSDFSKRFHPGQSVEFFAAILAGNQAARRNLTGSRRFSPYQFGEVGKLEMVNIFAGPFFYRFHSASQAERAQASDVPELLDFLDKESQKKYLGYDFGKNGQNEWSRRESQWQVRPEDFFIVRKNGRIKACALPWAPPETAKSMFYTKSPKLVEIGLGALRKLGAHVPKANENIKTLYLTHLHIGEDISAPEALMQLIAASNEKRSSAKAQMVSFADNWRCLDQLKFQSRLLGLRIGVVLVHVGKNNVPISGPSAGQPIELEMAVL